MALNGAAWAKRMEIHADEDFWDKWNALDDSPAPAWKSKLPV